VFRVCYCVRNGSGRAEKWTSVSPCSEDYAAGDGDDGSPVDAAAAAEAAEAGAYTRPPVSST
jgi:hypothetical protein